MAHYAPEFLAALRQRYEETDQPMRALALDFGIGISTLSALVEKQGWRKRSLRQRGSPDAPRIAEAAALMAALPPRAGGGVGPHAPPAPAAGSTAERLEALLVQEIAAEETARAELGTLPRLRAEADGCARRLAILTQTLKTLRDLAPAAAPHDAPPVDLDAMRAELTRRIEGLVLSRLGPLREALDRQFAELTDEQMQELAAVGRERGMEPLLLPPDVKAPLD
jgi:hypothetical protein